jgi:hypothetical protein
MSELTLLLDAARQGDPKAAGEAFGLLYEDLRRLARARLRPHYASRVMRSVIVDDARARAAERTVRRDWEEARPLLAAMR